ncbi:MAG: hypothetical protein GY798_24740 [Hyphomicrobiales bacterium]|nr:hypothetical protein [Hyphomicrobiales bacterium]
MTALAMRPTIAGAVAALLGAMPAQAQTGEGPTAGPAPPGSADIVVTARGQSATLRVKTNCAAAPRPIGRWTLYPAVLGTPLTLDFGAGVETNVTAKYDFEGGEVDGKYEGSEITGRWTQSTSDRKCAVRSPTGKQYWGDAVMTFNSANSLFSGYWNYCGDAASNKTWIGVRDCPTKAFDPIEWSIPLNATLYAQPLKNKDPEATPYQDRLIVAYAWYRTTWVCDAKGLRPKNTNEPLYVRRAYRRQVTGAYKTPVRYISTLGVRRVSAVVHEIDITMLAVETDDPSPIDFWKVPGKLMGLGSKLDAIKALATTSLDAKKFLDAALDKNNTEYRNIFRVQCERTPNGRFKIKYDQISSFPEVKSSGDLTWRVGAHGAHKENPTGRQ